MSIGSLADQVFYLIMPAAYRSGSDSTGSGRFGDFDGMRDAVPYLKDLGITTIITTPPFPSVAYHGYQHGPPTRIEPRLGGDEAFAGYVRAAHEAGMRVVIDLVAYGIDPRTLDHHEQLDDLAWENPQRTRATGYTSRTWNGRRVRFAHWNLRSPRARQRVIDWARRWLDPDRADAVDGLRLDHVWTRYPSDSALRTDGLAPGSPPWAEGWGYHLDTFWGPFAQAIRADRPDAMLIAEPADWGATGVELLEVFDGVLAKPLLFALRDAVLHADPSRWPGSAHPAGLGLLASSGDHDTDRLASTLPPQALRGALAMLLLGPAPPLLYAGDEIGMRGRRLHRLGGDAGDIGRREPFRWTADATWPDCDYWRPCPQAIRCRVNKRGDGVSVEEQLGIAGSLLEWVKGLLKLRRERLSLTEGTCERLAAPCGVWSVDRCVSGESTKLAINLTQESVRWRGSGDASGDVLHPYGVKIADESGALIEPEAR